MSNCKGKDCKYFKEYYNVINYNGAFTPNLELPTNRYCKHPKIHKSTGKLGDFGINVDTIKKCPDNE